MLSNLLIRRVVSLHGLCQRAVHQMRQLNQAGPEAFDGATVGIAGVLVAALGWVVFLYGDRWARDPEFHAGLDAGDDRGARVGGLHDTWRLSLSTKPPNVA